MGARARPNVLLAGAAAGAAGTTALNAITYLDMAVRGRPASNSPERSVEALSDKTGVAVPGSGETQDNRVQGLGPMLGLATGLGAGMVTAVLHKVGLRRLLPGAAAATAIALVGSNLPMASLGVSEPREWSANDWAADVVPHLAYGLVTAGVLRWLEG